MTGKRAGDRHRRLIQFVPRSSRCRSPNFQRTPPWIRLKPDRAIALKSSAGASGARCRFRRRPLQPVEWRACQLFTFAPCRYEAGAASQPASRSAIRNCFLARSRRTTLSEPCILISAQSIIRPGRQSHGDHRSRARCRVTANGINIGNGRKLVDAIYLRYRLHPPVIPRGVVPRSVTADLAATDHAQFHAGTTTASFSTFLMGLNTGLNN